MRFDELVLKVPGDEFRLRFHPRLTVLSGLQADERRALAESIRGALQGALDDTALRFVTRAGQAAIVVTSRGTTSTRDEAGSGPVVLPDPERVAELLVLGPVATSAPGVEVRPDDGPELRALRQQLAAALAEEEAAAGRRRQIERLHEEIAGLDARLADLDQGRPRREYARALAALGRARARATALAEATARVEADAHLLAGAASVQDAIVAWREAAQQRMSPSGSASGGPGAGQAPGGIGPQGPSADPSADRGASSVPTDPEGRAGLAGVPEDPPADLVARVDALRAACRERDRVESRLQALVVSQLPDPSDATVAQLAVLDQERLWAARDQLVTAEQELVQARVDIGGIELDDAAPLAVVDRIETAHARLDDLEAAAEASRPRGLAVVAGGLFLTAVGMVGPIVAVAAGGALALGGASALLGLPAARVALAERAERRALAATGAPTYLAFHLRRVEATVDPARRERASAAAREHRSALEAWRDMVPAGLDPTTATRLEAAVRTHHARLGEAGEVAGELHRLRGELAGRVEPQLRIAREALAATCHPYGLDDADLATDDPDAIERLVRDRVEAGREARAEAAREAARAAELAAAESLEGHLAARGFDDGTLPERVARCEAELAAAAQRHADRDAAGSVDDATAELARCERAVAELARPELDGTEPSDEPEPDPVALEATRLAALDQLHQEIRDLPDTDRVADRRAALERRVAALEATTAPTGGPTGPADQVRDHVLAHLDRASRGGPDGDPLPVLLDDVFASVPAEDKWDLLDLLHAASGDHQLVYLCDDAFVTAWARGRAGDDLRLLEPTPESA
ncbi:MAG: hypothetical protein AB7L84_01350 [Acidimicrobiia bacterium]